jgi:hypothetical protein
MASRQRNGGEKAWRGGIENGVNENKAKNETAGISAQRRKIMASAKSAAWRKWRRMAKWRHQQWREKWRSSSVAKMWRHRWHRQHRHQCWLSGESHHQWLKIIEA